MDIVGGIYFIVAMVVTVAIFLVALWEAGKQVVLLRRAPGPASLRISLCLSATVAAVLVNPATNFQLLGRHRQQTVAAMLMEIDTPTETVTQKYGEPHAVRGDDWRYRPGPWYVLMPWEEVIYRVHDGRVQGAFLDD